MHIKYTTRAIPKGAEKTTRTTNTGTTGAVVQKLFNSTQT